MFEFKKHWTEFKVKSVRSVLELLNVLGQSQKVIYEKRKSFCQGLGL